MAFETISNFTNSIIPEVGAAGAVRNGLTGVVTLSLQTSNIHDLNFDPQDLDPKQGIE